MKRSKHSHSFFSDVKNFQVHSINSTEKEKKTDRIILCSHFLERFVIYRIVVNRNSFCHEFAIAELYSLLVRTNDQKTANVKKILSDTLIHKKNRATSSFLSRSYGKSYDFSQSVSVTAVISLQSATFVTCFGLWTSMRTATLFRSRVLRK